MAKKREIRHLVDSRLIARQRLEKETGVLFKDHGGRISVALVYPNSYEIGMSNLGFNRVYQILNSRDDTVCERVFMPSPGEIDWMKKNRRTLETMESGRPLNKLDIIAFSITFEHDYINTLAILDLAGVPFRGRTQSHPVIVAGGICVTLNPEVMAPFFDMVMLGEAEGIIDPFIDTVVEHGIRSLPRFAQIGGIYVTRGYEPEYAPDGTIQSIDVAAGYPARVSRVWNTGYADNPNTTVIHTPDTIFGDMGLVEVGKGCGKHCRFCAAGYAYRPTRHVSYDALVLRIDEALERFGKVGLVGSAIADHPDFDRILSYITARGGRFSLSSMRLDMLTDNVIGLLGRGGVRTITVAPEAGSEGLRARINKNISDDRIIDAACRIARAGPFNLKLYFLVGLPYETDEDVDAIVSLAGTIRDATLRGSKNRGSAGEIILSVNGFVPKPVTPFQREPFAGVKKISQKLGRIRSGIKGVPNITLNTSSARYDYVQAFLSMGDRRAADYVERAYSLGGDWSRAFREIGSVDGATPDFFATRKKTEKEISPWSIVDHGFHKGYLERDMRRCGKNIQVEECPPPGTGCSRCGVFPGVCVGAVDKGE